MRYWNPNTESCYIKEQLTSLNDDVKKALVIITDEFWDECLKQNREGKIIKNNPSNNRPYCVEPEPYIPTIYDEIRDLQDYLDSTNDLVYEALEVGSTLEKINPDVFNKRRQARQRIKELTN